MKTTGRGARHVSAAAIVLLVAASALAAPSEIDQAQIDAGRVWYDRYCTSCHGPGGGPGSYIMSIQTK